MGYKKERSVSQIDWRKLNFFLRFDSVKTTKTAILSEYELQMNPVLLLLLFAGVRSQNVVQVARDAGLKTFVNCLYATGLQDEWSDPEVGEPGFVGHSDNNPE